MKRAGKKVQLPSLTFVALDWLIKFGSILTIGHGKRICMGKALPSSNFFSYKSASVIFLRFKLQSNYIFLGYRPQTWQFYLMFLLSFFFFMLFHSISGTHKVPGLPLKMVGHLTRSCKSVAYWACFMQLNFLTRVDVGFPYNILMEIIYIYFFFFLLVASIYCASLSYLSWTT